MEVLILRKGAFRKLKRALCPGEKGKGRFFALFKKLGGGLAPIVPGSYAPEHINAVVTNEDVTGVCTVYVVQISLDLHKF